MGVGRSKVTSTRGEYEMEDIRDRYEMHTILNYERCLGIA